MKIIYKTKLFKNFYEQLTHLTFTCSKLTMETVERGVKYVQS